MTTQQNESFQRPNTNVARVDKSLEDESEADHTSSEMMASSDNGAVMSSTKQCISCNREMPVSSESCVCGHVLSDIKSLEGKRYSGYREELYSRLEIKRILQDHDKPKRSKIKQKSLPAKQEVMRTLHKPQMKRRHRRKLPTPIAAHTKYENAFKVHKTEQSKLNENLDLCYLNPRFNFKDALADINKRLTSQTSFWISL